MLIPEPPTLRADSPSPATNAKLAGVPPRRILTAAGTPDGPSPRGPRIYIVDDEWIIASTLSTILKGHGFLATAFHNPSVVLTRATAQPPDVLLADVIMPGMTGIELAVALRRANVSSRILLFSGQTGAVDLLCDARRRGFDFELLEKPLHPLQLLLRLSNMNLPDADGILIKPTLPPFGDLSMPGMTDPEDDPGGPPELRLA